MVLIGSTDTLIQALIAGHVQVAIVDQSAAINAVERGAALKIIGGIGGLVGGLLLMAMLPINPMLKLFGIVLFTLIGYTIPSAQVSGMAARRQRTIQKQLADVMDLLTISVEAGLGFDQALSQVVKNVPGPLAEEMARLTSPRASSSPTERVSSAVRACSSVNRRTFSMAITA